MRYRYEPPIKKPDDSDLRASREREEETSEPEPAEWEVEGAPEASYQPPRYADYETPVSDSGSGMPTWIKVILTIGAVLITISLVVSMAGPLLFNRGAQSAQSEIEYEVADYVSAVDVSTIVVDLDGNQETVRLIGIEGIYNDPTIDQQVAAAVDELLDGTAVSLELGEVDRDSEGNLLRYVYTNDGSMLNGLLILNGFAAVGDALAGNDRYLARMRGWQEVARAESRGLWQTTN